jgi:membrane protease YdiL (CAAX protease family)
VKAVRRVLLDHPTIAFFVLACGLSWLVWLPAVIAHLRRGTDLGQGAPLFFLGSLGPLASALILRVISGGVNGVRVWLGTLTRWQVGLFWYALALYGFPALGLLTMLFLGVANLQAVLAQLPRALWAVPANALTSFLLLGPLGEEPGWRGYALPRLQAENSALTASVVLGLLWALWHAPLVLLPDWRNDLPIGAFLILYPLYIVALTVIFTWLYNGASGSVLVIIVLHASFNYTLFFLDRAFGFSRYDALAVQAVSTAVLWLLAAVLIGVVGSDLGLRRGVRPPGDDKVPQQSAKAR